MTSVSSRAFGAEQREEATEVLVGPPDLALGTGTSRTRGGGGEPGVDVPRELVVPVPRPTGVGAGERLVPGRGRDVILVRVPEVGEEEERPATVALAGQDSRSEASMRGLVTSPCASSWCSAAIASSQCSKPLIEVCSPPEVGAAHDAAVCHPRACSVSASVV